MGLEPYLLNSALRLVLNQRLLRKLCNRCNGGACEICNHTGYQGRFLLVEAMVLCSEMRQAILQRADKSILQGIFKNSGGITLASHALNAVKNGTTTKEEVLRVLGPSECMAFFNNHSDVL
jgi:type II secretory ATPase GspE/PulE/Tfp pilus assembly ATPase PilB-like protein